MEKFKQYILRNFESLFILLILVSVALINYFVYSKIAFLNFYYLPVLAAGYFLGRRTAILGAFLTILMVLIYVLINQEGYLGSKGTFDLYFNLTVWGGFLILSGALIGQLSEKFKIQLEHSNRLQKDLAREREQLKISNDQLHEYSTRLEEKVAERTQELERSHNVIESLKEKVENALFSVMDAKVARLMIEGKLHNEKRRITVLFSDLKDFTSYSEDQPPEKVVEELNRYLTHMEDCLTSYYGHIDKYTGDGIMAEFGAPVTYHMHCLMAVVAALSMQKKLGTLNPDWNMRIGIATGPSVIGLFGSKRKSYSCIGGAANLASRLENICHSGSIFIDEATYKEIQPYVHAARVYDLYGQRETDLPNENDIAGLTEKLSRNPEDEALLLTLGNAYFRKRAASQAIECYEKILKINPGNTAAKLGFAEANLKRDEFEKIAIKGKRGRVPVFRVIGLSDPMLERQKIPEAFFNKYSWVESKIQIPSDVVLPLETIDGSVGHSKMVAILSYAIADKLGLPREEKENILIAGFFHDIGKEIVPPEILENRMKLNIENQADFRKHPTESVKIMKKMGYQTAAILNMVETHHERFDGSGFPKGLKGEETPLGGRILAVADLFDTMTSKRLYAETWEYKSAIHEIQKEADKGLYDPRVVEALRELFGV